MVSNLSGGGVEESKSPQQQPCLCITDGENCRIQTNMFNNKPQLVYDVGGVQESKSLQQPWLLIADRRENCRLRTNMFNNKPQLVYDVGGEIPEFLGRKIGSSCGKWVLLTGTTDNDVLVNLLSKEIIELPSLDIPHDFCALTSHPYDPTCHIVYFSKEENAFMFCQPGDKEFTIKKWDHELFPTQLAVVARKLFLYLPSCSISTFTVGLIEFKESTYQFEVVEMDCESSWEFIEDYFLFEYSGEFFVLFQIGGRAISKYVIGHEIFKADFLNKKLVSVKNLGDVAIFIGNETAHVQCASVESGIKANSIYFLEEDDLDNYYVHSLEEGTIRMKLTFFSSMEIETTKDTQHAWILMPCEASFRKLLKGDQESVCQDSEKENKASDEVGVQNSWNLVPPELLNLIQLHLFGRDHAVFRVVCKPWHQVSSIPDYSIPALLSWTTLLELCQSSSPLLMFQEDMTVSDDTVPIFRFLDPVHKKLYRTGIPELREADIHYSIDGWLLVCRRSDERSFFFFNPLTQEKIELPRIPSDLFFYAQYYNFSFSSLPTCSNCLVVGMQRTTMEMYTLKHGEETWRKQEHYEFENADKREYGHCPVVLHGLHHFMCDNRDMSVFYLKNDGVEVEGEDVDVGEGEGDGEDDGEGLESESWSSKCKQSLGGEDFFLEVDGALAFVSVEAGGGGISIFKWNDLKTDWELMEGGVDFGGKQMFISRRGSFMEKIDDVGGMGSTIFLPMVDDAKQGVFYSLTTHRYHTLYSGYSSELLYNVDKFLNGVWVKPDKKIVGEHNLKWFM